MTETQQSKISHRLASEGLKTLDFFRALSPENWNNRSILPDQAGPRVK